MDHFLVLGSSCVCTIGKQEEGIQSLDFYMVQISTFATAKSQISWEIYEFILAFYRIKLLYNKEKPASYVTSQK